MYYACCVDVLIVFVTCPKKTNIKLITQFAQQAAHPNQRTPLCILLTNKIVVIVGLECVWDVKLAVVAPPRTLCLADFSSNSIDNVPFHLL